MGEFPSFPNQRGVPRLNAIRAQPAAPTNPASAPPDIHNVGMDNLQPARTAFPTEDCARAMQRIRREGQCFICRVVDRAHRYRHHIVYEDADTFVFKPPAGVTRVDLDSAVMTEFDELPPGTPSGAKK